MSAENLLCPICGQTAPFAGLVLSDGLRSICTDPFHRDEVRLVTLTRVEFGSLLQAWNDGLQMSGSL